MVALTYPRVVAKQEAQSDLESIVRQTRWSISEPRMTVNPESTPDRPAMTSVEFAAANALPGHAGALPVEPLVIALKRLPSIFLIFAMRSDYQFRGLRDFENKFVRVKFMLNGQTYTYQVHVKDAGFTTLDLPTVLQPGQVPPTRGTIAFIVIPLVISAGVAAAVWLIVQTVRTRKTA